MKKLCAALIAVFVAFICLKVAANSIVGQPVVNRAAVIAPVEK